MSNLVYQNYNNKCQGWTKPNSLVFVPHIGSLSGYYSPAGSTTLVSIVGQNFVSFSSVAFGQYYPTVYFINSNNLQFYVPSTLNSGIYTVQVFNGSIDSNPVTYEIDNASGYWLSNSNGSIENTNSGPISVKSLCRGKPETVTDNAYTVPKTVNWIICNNANDIIVTLPSVTQNIGREIMLKNVNEGAVVSSGNVDISGSTVSYVPNIMPLTGTTYADLTNTILPSGKSGAWATIVYDGTNWITMQASGF